MKGTAHLHHEMQEEEEEVPPQRQYQEGSPVYGRQNASNSSPVGPKMQVQQFHETNDSSRLRSHLNQQKQQQLERASTGYPGISGRDTNGKQ